MRAIYFTDNIMLAVPAWPDEDDLGIGYALGTAADYQADLAFGGRFSRGGMSYGPVYADHSFGTGPAWLDAIGLEKKAVLPRVLLDDACVEVSLRAVQALAFSPLELDVDRLILRDGEYAFINYLGALFDSKLWYTDEALTAHAEAIHRNRAKFADDEHIKQKYEWLADYHDYFVTQIYWCPQCVIGSSQSRGFAPLTNRRFGLGDLTGEPLASAFRHSIAKDDVRTIVDAGRPTAGELVQADYPDLEWFASSWWPAGMAIYCLAALRKQLTEQRVPSEYTEKVSELACRCDAVVRSVASEFFTFRGSFRAQTLERLLALADVLKVVRQQPGLWNVGLLKVEELERAV